MRIGVSYLSYDDLRQIAQQFLDKFNPGGAIPVPIEEIIDLRFKLDIVPTPGLQAGFDVEAFITSSLTAIYVDEYVYKHRPNRYRFSLAHELSHVILHRDIYKRFLFSSIEQWKAFVESFPEKEYTWIEWQAYALAGLILVPAQALKDRFRKASATAAKQGLSLANATEAARHTVEGYLGRQFEVSAEVVHRRLEYDNLWQ